MDRIEMQDSKASNSLWSQTATTQPLSTTNLNRLESKYDVAIIGGGYSGLWSAFHLIQKNPGMKIAIFEAEHLGFGASGRNGGWVSTEYPVSNQTLRGRIGISASELLFRSLKNALDEIGEFAERNAPEAGFVKSGSVYFARNGAQLSRLKRKLEVGQFWLSRAELNERINIDGALGGIFNPNCGSIHPLNLVIALARYLLGQGVSIFEGTWADAISGGVAVKQEYISAPVVIQATEVFGRPARDFIPLYSLMVATEPLSEDIWRELGNNDRFTFAENSHMVNYAQRTLDNRIAIGGRGATYPFNSRLTSDKENSTKVHETIRSLLRSWFPQLKKTEFTFAWGGAVSVTRDWEPYINWDKKSGFARLGGYAGDGVTMSYLAGKIIAGEISNSQDEVRAIHFVNRTTRKWEPEPMRYLGVNTLVKLSGLADREEKITKRPSLLNRIIEPLILR